VAKVNQRMDTKRKLIASTLALLAMAAAITAAPPAAPESDDATARAVAALEANVGKASKVEVDEVRVTARGVACIEYRVGAGQRAHAVVQGDEVLKSSADARRFEEEWNKHCLGPRGGTTGS
jgi:hypothetical protein